MNPSPRSVFASAFSVCAFSLLLGVCAALCPTAAVRAATLPSGFTETQVASGFGSKPTRLEIAPDGRVFVLTQGGGVRVVKNGALLSTPFMTLTVSSSGERGVLGIAFDPNFTTNRFLYIYYTATSPTTHNRISRFTASSTNPDVVEAGSEVVVFDAMPTLGDIYHNGGDIHFGPTDGKLYVAVGDNKTGGAPAQSMTSLLGKILRINSDGTIPTDNPFYGTNTGNYRAIWARGLRNPFSFAIQAGTGKIVLNDVGEATWEEVNDGVAGANYGWPATEGPTSDPNYESPLYSYNHNTGGCAIVGATFYNPANQQFPSTYVGKYFFADLCAGYIKYLNVSTGTASSFATGITNPIGVFTAADGSLYYLTEGGSLYQIRYTTAPSIATQPQSQLVSPGQQVTFSVTANGSTPLSYQWQRGTTNISGATSASYTFTAAVSDNGATFRCVVTNSVGSATSNSATLTVTNDPNAPVPTITSPALNTTYAGGDTVAFAATATDVEDGTLPASAYTWEVVFHHNVHTHPFIAPFSGVTSGTFAVPVSGETSDDVWLRIHLTVIDSGGRTTEVTRDIFPRKADATLASSPAALQVTLDGQPFTTPTTVTGVEGLVRTLGASTLQTVGTQTYRFQTWSDGGDATHEISAPASNTTYTANYATVATSTSVLMEAESLAFTASGATTAIVADAATSGGNWVQLNADGVGDSVTFTTTSLAAGTYQVRLKYKAYTSRGQLSLKIDGNFLGNTLDQYSATATYPEATLGTVAFASAGTHSVELAVTGKNAASSGYNLSADLFTFVPLVLNTVAAPTYNPPGARYTGGQSVALASTTSGASIRYTTDGSTPTSTTGTLYAAPVSIPATATLKAIAYKSGMTDSAVTSATYTVGPAAPRFSPGAGSYTSAQNVTITTTSGGASIRYTTDGSTPSATVGTVYSSPVSIASTATLKAVAYQSGQSDSTVTSGTYSLSGGTPINAEFETMTVNASSGDAINVVADAATSGGQWHKYSANAVNDFITFSLNVPTAGTYQIQVKVKAYTDRSIVQLATADAAGGPFTNKDSPKDFYAATATYPTFTYTNTVTFATSGTKYLRFTVTGKNAASTSYVIPLDALILTPQ